MSERQTVRDAIVLAGGRGQRMAPFTSVLPKPLLPIGDRPILEILLRQLAQSGVEQVHLAVGYLSQLVESYFGDGSRFGVHLTYHREEEPLGTAAPIRFVADGLRGSGALPPSFFVLNGDLLMDVDFAALAARHGSGTLSILVAEREHRVDLGVLEIDGAGRLVDYVEKPVHHYHVSTGVYVFPQVAVARITPGRRLDFPDLVRDMLRDGFPVHPVHLRDVGSLWMDLGRPEDYERGCRLFEEAPERFLPAAQASGDVPPPRL
ncbi:MAG: NDP-sugar synthase [Candidatus Binatia bacterium]